MTTAFARAGALAALLLAAPASAATLSNDNVLSQHLKEADGTSGQNTNAGSGVKTNHLQDAAVTAGKLAAGAVTAAKLAPAAVGAAAIADGAVAAAKLAPAAVGTAAIADGAVTPAKLSGPLPWQLIGTHGHDAGDLVSGTVPFARLPVGSAPGTVAAGDHTHPFVAPGKPANVVVVARAGGDFTDPVAAMASIADASAANPYVVRIMPGVYALASTLQMKDYVDVEGSGRNVTVLQGSVASTNGNLSDGPGLVNGANHAELRALTVRNRVSSGSLGIGVYAGLLDDFGANLPATFSIRDVDIQSSYDTSGSPPAWGTAMGVNLWYSNTRIRGTRILVDGAPSQAYGILCSYNFIDVKDSEIEVRTASAGFGFATLGWGNVTAPDIATRLEDVKVVIAGAAPSKYGILVGQTATLKGAALIKDVSVSIRDGNQYGTPVTLSGAPNVKCIGVVDGLYEPIACQ